LVQKTLGKLGKFFREVRAELGKVIWPDRRTVTVYTGIVVATVAVVAGVIWVSDVVVGQLIALMLR
jgi:preprotein translocase subunit SecE